MPRILKSYVTSLGFFDQAIAAPSMKAALAAWGADSNLFHQGFAKETNDPEVIAATMANPGIVLKRPVGSGEPFREHATLPKYLSQENSRQEKDHRKPPNQSLRKIDDQVARKAALAFEKTERQREAERRKEEAVGAKQQERRHRAVAKAEAALEKAKREHGARAVAIEAERNALKKRSRAESNRWEKHEEKLQRAVRRARNLP